MKIFCLLILGLFGHSSCGFGALVIDFDWVVNAAETIQGKLQQSEPVTKDYLLDFAVGNLVEEVGSCSNSGFFCAARFPKANQLRTVLEVKFNFKELLNKPGVDFAVFATGQQYKPSGFAVAVTNFELDWISKFRYQFSAHFNQMLGTPCFVTLFDLSDFGIEEGKGIDTIRIANLFNMNSPGFGDRVDHPSGQGQVLFQGNTEIGFPILAGPLSHDTLYPNSQLEPRIIAVAGVIRATP